MMNEQTGSEWMKHEGVTGWILSPPCSLLVSFLLPLHSSFPLSSLFTPRFLSSPHLSCLCFLLRTHDSSFSRYLRPCLPPLPPSSHSISPPPSVLIYLIGLSSPSSPSSSSSSSSDDSALQPQSVCVFSQQHGVCRPPAAQHRSAPRRPGKDEQERERERGCVHVCCMCWFIVTVTRLWRRVMSLLFIFCVCVFWFTSDVLIIELLMRLISQRKMEVKTVCVCVCVCTCVCVCACVEAATVMGGTFHFKSCHHSD